MLSCRVGVKHFGEVEDAVQSALAAALENWTASGVPDNPSAWLFRVANNNLIGEFRKRKRRDRLLEQHSHKEAATNDESEATLAGEMRDSLLRMLFVCCDESIPTESQIVLAMKVLCGFDVREIAIRLFTTEANIYKRFGRAKKRFQELDLIATELSEEQYSQRLPVVQQVLYLLFTEGYLSSKADEAVRRELCEEAIRLASILADHETGKTPETFALLALMHLQTARLSGRQDELGELLLLEEQNRNLWDQVGIQEGFRWLAMSATGDKFSRYHAEAAVVAEHCRATSFQEIDWEAIAENYALLEQATQSPIHRLNRAVAVAEHQSPEAGLAVLQNFQPPTWLSGSYLWAAVMSDLNRRCGNTLAAKQYGELACESAPTPQLKRLLQRRLRIKDSTDE